jgi:hypothetical protein
MLLAQRFVLHAYSLAILTPLVHHSHIPRRFSYNKYSNCSWWNLKQHAPKTTPDKKLEFDASIVTQEWELKKRG